MQQVVSNPRIALVYDHLITEFGGAELVLASFHQAFPEAPLFTTVFDKNTAHWAKNIHVVPSGLQKFGKIFFNRELLDLVTPITLEQFDFSQFEIVISITSSAAKGILTTPKQLHICYLLSPTRYLYQDKRALLDQHRILSMPGLNLLAELSLRYLTWWDQVAATRPDKIITISEVVSRRLQTYYQRQADILLYPPVGASLPAQESTPPRFPQPFLLSLSRLVPYKRVELTIQACLELKQLLVVAGIGREGPTLQKLAGQLGYHRPAGESLETAMNKASNQKKLIVFLGPITEREKTTLLATCQAVCMPGVEDFGITALEANAYGKPVLLSRLSGAAEVIQDSVHGIYLDSPDTTALITALQKLKKTRFSREKLQKNAAHFQQSEFVRKLHNIVYQFYSEHSTIVR